ncbi:cytochrome d ubiquinol oxidase subunit II [Kaistia dalseonensis]|uniref:Cytochrome d ubiquinol oxidase subunit II n=1 Tax=Kaistia dalseonensis TaxID=410840 RepID=A0ABU0H9N6_9HYPH|nr:cytochrome d ubiquinol oxidase subunit II [Kaistia dalseonensis]MCX5495601.1 cytochrome d ubiquinol oxidase subunit II [Kaistia dalseonensis]MDQ0438194.1 cytochrome d ubiquinol oxidase subunit II [Kaistia dalseonensis]
MVEFWAFVLGLSILLYILLDGFDLGVGMLSPFAANEDQRRRMLASISPVWDGNETWLVVSAATLFGAFPAVFSIVLAAFYLPLFIMLAGLILRGVAFEFRYKATRSRPLWDAGFVVGSYAAAFVQGAAVGAIVQGLPIENGVFTGNALSWISPFALFCGVGLCLGYALLGACWIAQKSEGSLRAFGFRALPGLMAALLAFLIAVFVWSLAIRLPVLHRWIERPILLLCPLLGFIAFAGLVQAVRRGSDRFLYLGGATIFIAAFAALAGSFLPYMLPFSLTIWEAASPASSLEFLFWGAGLFVLPLTLAYTLIVYFVFRGKIVEERRY